MEITECRMPTDVLGPFETLSRFLMLKNNSFIIPSKIENYDFHKCCKIALETKNIGMDLKKNI